MSAAFDDLQILAHHDPIKLCDRSARMKASATLGDLVAVGEVAKAATIGAPFVEVAHHHRRRLSMSVVEVRKDRLRLPPPP